jgi:hypothetical protein
VRAQALELAEAEVLEVQAAALVQVQARVAVVVAVAVAVAVAVWVQELALVCSWMQGALALSLLKLAALHQNSGTSREPRKE